MHELSFIVFSSLHVCQKMLFSVNLHLHIGAQASKPIKLRLLKDISGKTVVICSSVSFNYFFFLDLCVFCQELIIYIG